jgi:anti-sigma factor (TIGR02949 family)
MGDCGCEKARAGLEEFIHGELDASERDDVAEHFANCPPCDEEKTVGLVLTKKVKQACCETAPDELTRSIVDELRKDAAR